MRVRQVLGGIVCLCALTTLLTGLVSSAAPQALPGVAATDSSSAAIDTLQDPCGAGDEVTTSSIPGTATFARDQSADELEVSYSVGGTAVAESDYETLSGTVSFAPGSETASISVVPLPTAQIGTTTVLITLEPGPSYTIGAPQTVEMEIARIHAVRDADCPGATLPAAPTTGAVLARTG